MNLFYVTTDGTGDKVINSELSVELSPILPIYTDAYSFEGDIVFFEDGGSDGFWIHSGKANPISYDTGLSLKTNYKTIHVMSAQRQTNRRLYKINLDGTLTLITTESKAQIAYGNGIYCYVYVSGTNELTVGKSIDGDLWEYNTITTSKVTSSPNICFGNNSFIICDGDVYKSEDCVTWSIKYSDSLYWSKIVYTSFGFTILNDTNLLISVDGISWSLLTLPAITIDNPFLETWKNLIVNQNVLCMFIRNGDFLSELIFSLDGGISWINRITLPYGYINIFSLSVADFWNQFIRTTES